MTSLHQDEPPTTSPESSQPLSVHQSIPPSNYLTVPGRTERRSRRSPLPRPRLNDINDPDRYLESRATSLPAPLRVLPSQNIAFSSTTSSPSGPQPIHSRVDFRDWPAPVYMSIYSTSSQDSEYSIPPARPYKLPSFATMSESRKITLVRHHFFNLPYLNIWIGRLFLFHNMLVISRLIRLLGRKGSNDASTACS